MLLLGTPFAEMDPNGLILICENLSASYAEVSVKSEDCEMPVLGLFMGSSLTLLFFCAPADTTALMCVSKVVDILLKVLHLHRIIVRNSISEQNDKCCLFTHHSIKSFVSC